MPNLANHVGMMEVKVAGRKVSEGKGEGTPGWLRLACLATTKHTNYTYTYI